MKHSTKFGLQLACGCFSRKLARVGRLLCHQVRSGDTWWVCTSKMNSSPSRVSSAAAGSKAASAAAGRRARPAGRTMLVRSAHTRQLVERQQHGGGAAARPEVVAPAHPQAAGVVEAALEGDLLDPLQRRRGRRRDVFSVGGGLELDGELQRRFLVGLAHHVPRPGPDAPAPGAASGIRPCSPRIVSQSRCALRSGRRVTARANPGANPVRRCREISRRLRPA